MALRPEDNPKYWPLLLTDELYLLAEDRQQVQAGPAPTIHQSTPAAAIEPSATPTTAAAKAPEAPQPDLLWGSLERGVLVLVDYPEHPLMDRPDGLFLVEILKAVGFDFKSVATLNISRCKTTADWEWLHNLSWQQAISFGIQHPELAFTQQAALYQKIEHEGRTVLLAESLAHIRADQGRKKQLWNLLRQAFV